MRRPAVRRPWWSRRATSLGTTAVVAGVLVLGACSEQRVEPPSPPETRSGAATSAPPTPSPTAAVPDRRARAERPVRPGHFDTGAAVAAVQHLAGTIGPRHATSPAYRRAARWAARRLRDLGHDVRREPVAVPAGDSWGVPVAAGRSWNVVATPPGFDPARPHLVVGAHLDTVAVAPGAEDNASGVAVLLAAAAATAGRTTRLPVVWIAFGAEEPRGPGDDDHHYGSRAYVAGLAPEQRSAVVGMVSLDRVGVGAVVPVGSAGNGDPVQRALLDAGRRAGVEVVSEADSRSSDHWSFVRAGLPGARLGSTPYAAYHSAGDRPEVVQPDQLRRTGRLLLAWLAPR